MKKHQKFKKSAEDIINEAKQKSRRKKTIKIISKVGNKHAILNTSSTKRYFFKKVKNIDNAITQLITNR